MKTATFFIVAAYLGLIAMVSIAFAEEVAEKKALSDEGDLAFVQTGGNTNVTSLAVKNQAKYKFNEQWLGAWKAGALHADANDVKTAESYYTDLKLDYQNTQRLYSFVNAGWQQNRFAGVDEHVYEGAGEGYKFLNGPNNFLIGELSAMSVSDKYTNKTMREYPTGRAFVKYDYAFTKTNKFSQSLEYLDDLNDSRKYFVNSETAFISKLNGKLSLKTSYIVNYSNEPVPATLKRTDTMLTAAIVVTY